jgi:Ni2+-binding GTPase involved in maturation of urease and hydrogenase
MNTNEDGKEIICETKMEVSAYITEGGGIAIEQLDPMMNESGLIVIQKSDVSPLIRALSKLKKRL